MTTPSTEQSHLHLPISFLVLLKNHLFTGSWFVRRKRLRLVFAGTARVVLWRTRSSERKRATKSDASKRRLLRDDGFVIAPIGRCVSMWWARLPVPFQRKMGCIVSVRMCVAGRNPAVTTRRWSQLNVLGFKFWIPVKENTVWFFNLCVNFENFNRNETYWKSCEEIRWFQYREYFAD